MSDMMHPDQAQDIELLKKELGPVLDLFNSRLCALEDAVYKMVSSFSDAVTGQRKSGLGSMLSEKFGADLEPFKPVYQDFKGSDLMGDLVDALADYDGDPEEAVRQFIGELTDKFGKYAGVTPKVTEVSAEIPAEGEESASPASEGTEGKAQVTATSGSEEKPGENKKPQSAVDNLMQTVLALRAGRGKTA